MCRMGRWSFWSLFWRKSVHVWRKYARKTIFTFSFPVTFEPQICSLVIFGQALRFPLNYKFLWPSYFGTNGRTDRRTGCNSLCRGSLKRTTVCRPASTIRRHLLWRFIGTSKQLVRRQLAESTDISSARRRNENSFWSRSFPPAILFSYLHSALPVVISV